MEDRDVEWGWEAGVAFAEPVSHPGGRCPLGKQLASMAAAQGKNGARGRDSRVSSL